MATRKSKPTAHAADESGGAVTRAALDAARQSPDISTAVSQLQPVGEMMRYAVDTLPMNTPTDRLVMADFLRQVKDGMAAVDAKFDPIIKPMYQALEAARAWRREVMKKFTDAEDVAKKKLGDYALREAAAVRAESAKREQADREERERQQAAARAAAISVTAPAWVVGGVGVPVTEVYPPVVFTPRTPPLPASVYADPMEAVRAPAPMSGVSTALSWTVEVDNDAQATAFLIAQGLWDCRSAGAAAVFVHLDTAALKMAVKGEGDTAQLMRGLLANVPGVRVCQVASVTARRYE